ncbi:hypothetical protein [Piscinibacter sp. HJYY11]|uniref:hypothetical protein n=1 Tax=Piscinibacter sp. HJYY11 TaxID=2801333 RepID=UPI00191CC569|nr:hypothetical protein [Piscinibacter sp. HJYY11]MBL0726171.1 hypothetical protein [Piscinibacter sp. HJYY11]
MKRLRWELARAANGLGLPGGAALAMLVGAGAVWLTLVLPARDDTERLQEERARLERRLNGAAGDQAVGTQGVREQLAEFRTRFGDEKSLGGSLGALHAVARKHGLQLDQAEFKLSGDARDPLWRYAIVLPVKTDYRALRRFTQDALRTLPGLALEEVSLRRGDARAAQVEAQLRFVLFLHRSP